MDKNVERNKAIQREKNRLRKQKQRALHSEEKKLEIRCKQREYKQQKRLAMSEEELEQEQEKNRIYMQQKRMGKSKEELEQEQEKNRIYMQQKRMGKCKEELEQEQEKNRIYMQQKRMGDRKLTAQQEEETYQGEHIERNFYIHGMSSCHEIDLSTDVSFGDKIAECQASLNRTLLEPDEEGYIEGSCIHKALVCVVCDRCIIGKDLHHWIPATTLKYHEKILSAHYHYSNGINAHLKLQYSVDDEFIFHLLLSPRARKRLTDNSYMCCDECFKNLAELKVRKKPPKYAISNGFAIGHLPTSIAKDVTPLVNNLVAPIRAFNYFVSFNGGREQKITGNFTFFAQDVSQNMGTLQHISSTNNNPTVFIVLLGSFTSAQLEKIKKQGSCNVETFKNVYRFLHDNNEYYSTLPSVENVPLPLIQQIRLHEGENEIEEGGNSATEEELCWRYWFPNVEDPNGVSSSYQNCSDFAKALFVGEAPTLFYHPTKIISHAKLSQLCPLAFPFGTGDVSVKRSPAVSEIECLQHYLKLSLPQFLEGQTVLIIHHMYQRRRSFLSGIAKCNVSHNGNTIADQLAVMTVQQVDDAITEMKRKVDKSERNNLPTSVNSNNPDTSTENDSVSPHIAELLKCIKTSCIPIGYTNEASCEARNKMFALWMTFGPPALLFTFSPCDECSFKMQLFATMEPAELPSIHKPIEILTMQLGLRKSMRVKHPGACAREFDSLLQIVLKDLIGWDGKKSTHCGIFGKVNAYSAGVEEQGRTSLHGHIILWILNYLNLQQQLFSKNKAVRDRAIQQMREYLEKVMCSSFDISKDEVMISLNGECNCSSNVDQLVGASFQELREMRHIELRKQHEGKILRCKECNKRWSTVEVVNSVIKRLYHWSKQEHPTFWPEDISFPLKHEQVELLALRTQFDMIDITPVTKKYTCRLLQLLVALFFNTHDWKHRKGCFKKSNECRFHIPHKPCQELTLSFLDENYFQKLSEDDMLDENSKQDDDFSNLMCYWYNHDGSKHRVCSYEVQPKREDWDVFMNTNNATVSRLFGYNNNICMGSINLLYYCTLYTSKSNQEDETYPYVKALEAVASRLKRVQENDSESGISQRQIGLRNLLCGINSHISSCVVSATMAWYLVTHGTRFHFSHDFKPLLLSQFEAWFQGTSYRRRIRYKKARTTRRNNNDDGIGGLQSPNTPPLVNEDSNVWFDSSVSDYLFRPSCCDIDFDNISVWEYTSKFDLVSSRPKNFMEDSEEHDANLKKFRFLREHPGFEFSCLSKREVECIPKLYYSNKFPDVALLDIQEGNNVEDYVKETREVYALKAMLMFFPFRDKEELLGNHCCMWDAFMEQKNRLMNSINGGTVLSAPGLYKHSLQILQNIQDLLNVKKVPIGQEILQSCTSINETEDLYEGRGAFAEECNNCPQQEDPESFEMQIDQLAHYINILSQENSVFNNSFIHSQASQLSTTNNSSIISIQSSTFSNVSTSHVPELIDDIEMQHEKHSPPNAAITEAPIQSIVTVLTRALDVGGVNVNLCNAELNNRMNTNDTVYNIDKAICSLAQFALQNKLDRKQTIAFQTICASFILTFVNDITMDITQSERDHYSRLLQQKGATPQLLMCVTGPGGSGKSHIIKCCRMYCKLFCDALGKPFNFSVFPVTATSNAAAALLQGFTIHSAALINSNYVQMELSSDVDWTMTKVLIIDEISMADKKMFRTLDKNLRILTGNKHLLYGGIHIVFTGDFMQLPPVRGTPIFNEFDDLLWHQSLNAAVFLDEKNHRFLTDPEWGKTLERVQWGVPTDDDIAKINSRLITLCQPPDNIDCKEKRIAYGCYSNKKRNQITDAVFLKYIMSNSPLYTDAREPNPDILILKGFVTKQRKDVGDDFHKVLWALCGDNNLSVGTQCKVDPCLKLIKGSPVMFNKTIDRKLHIVKGVGGNFIGVTYRLGCVPHVEDYYGYKVNAAHVTDIECMTILLSIDGKVVEIRPETFSPTIKFPTCNDNNVMKGYQILQVPINLSLAITGHKLQGMTLDMLILSEINLKSNWLYVLLSRVTTLKGLYLMKSITKEMFRAPSRNLRREIEWLRQLENQLLQRLENSTNII